MIKEGAVIGGYTLMRKIGKGGFGEVWLAERRTELATTRVAIKFSIDEDIDLQVVKNEALVWAAASGHPNVLPIIEANIYDGHVAIVSEFAPDGSLEELLRKHSVLPVKRALELTLGILSGLQFLHSKQIIHRDIKPANVLLQGETPRLSDFGISRLSKQSVSLSSQTIAGTPKYMAPETFDGKRNAQSDIWAVGVMLYQMIAGYFPFPQEETTELIGAIVLKNPAALPAHIPQAVQNIIYRALSKDISQRYQSAAEMRQQLFQLFSQIPDISDLPTEHVRPTSPQNAAQVTPVGQFSPTIANNSVATALPVPVPKKRSNLPFILGGVFVVVLFFLGISAAGIYYVAYRGYAPIKPDPAKTPSYGVNIAVPSPWPGSEVNNNAGGLIYDSPEKMKEVIASMEKEAGGKLKLVDFNIYPTYVISKMRDPDKADNYDRYTWRAGKIEKEPEKIMIDSDKDSAKLFSTDDINWEAIPGLVKAAKEKNIEGAGDAYVFISRFLPFSKDIKVRVYISGARKNVNLEADAEGKIKVLEVK